MPVTALNSGGSCTVQFRNDTGSTIARNTIVKQGSLIGNTACDSPAGELGVLEVHPGFEVEVSTIGGVAFAVGAPVYIVTSTSLATPSDPAGAGYRLGLAVPGAGGIYGGLTAANAACKTTESRVRVRLD